MFSAQDLILLMIVVGMLSLPLALAWVVIDAWFEERRLARLDVMPTVGPALEHAVAEPNIGLIRLRGADL